MNENNKIYTHIHAQALTKPRYRQKKSKRNEDNAYASKGEDKRVSFTKSPDCPSAKWLWCHYSQIRTLPSQSPPLQTNVKRGSNVMNQSVSECKFRIELILTSCTVWIHSVVRSTLAFRFCYHPPSSSTTLLLLRLFYCCCCSKCECNGFVGVVRPSNKCHSYEKFVDKNTIHIYFVVVVFFLSLTQSLSFSIVTVDLLYHTLNSVH